MRIAVPNKGSLSEPAVEMLREAGYRVRRDSKELIIADPELRKRAEALAARLH